MANEKRLIDANALIATLEKIVDEDETPFFHLDEITDEIMDAPTVDAVEVVRCKDCKYWERLTEGNLCGSCNGRRNGLTEEYTTEDDFCSYGERGTDE